MDTLPARQPPAPVGQRPIHAPVQVDGPLQSVDARRHDSGRDPRRRLEGLPSSSRSLLALPSRDAGQTAELPD